MNILFNKFYKFNIFQADKLFIILIFKMWASFDK
jgi:hypothetical protein